MIEGFAVPGPASSRAETRSHSGGDHPWAASPLPAKASLTHPSLLWERVSAREGPTWPSLTHSSRLWERGGRRALCPRRGQTC